MSPRVAGIRATLDGLVGIVDDVVKKEMGMGLWESMTLYRRSDGAIYPVKPCVAVIQRIQVTDGRELAGSRVNTNKQR